MPTEQELLGIINGQRKYYRDGILRLADLLRGAGLEDYARAAIYIADNYGIIDANETKTQIGRFNLDEQESLILSISRELSNGELSARLLRARTGNPGEPIWKRTIRKLIDDGKIVQIGTRYATVYKLAS